MKTTVTLSPRKFRSAWKGFSFTCLQVCAALLLLPATTVKSQTNPVISAFEFKAAVVWSNALSGHSYAVQRTSALETGPWFNVPGLSNVPPTSSVMTVSFPVSGPTGFYRVLDNGPCCTNSGGTDPPSAV